MLIVAKFGGTSLKDAASFLKVRELILEEPARRGIVVSAPGRRFPEDPKVTDLLLKCYDARERGEVWEVLYHAAAARFREICRGLGVLPEIEGELYALEEKIRLGVTRDYLASRGEYFSAMILAALLGWEFIDSARWLRLDETGRADTVRSYGLLRSLVTRPFVTPGFYGADSLGEIRTFPRGGSDITGALAAAALDAGKYENWTDVPGILTADPRLLPQARPVSHLTYEELAELTAVGTQVLHEGAVQPVAMAGIPLHIRSTFQPREPGTLISSRLPEAASRSRVLGLAGKRERALLSLKTCRPGLLASLLEQAGVEADLLTCALGKQTASVPSGKVEEIMEHLGPHLGELHLQDGLALAAVLIAREEKQGPRASDLLTAVKEAGIPIYSVLRPFSGHTLLLTVPDSQYLAALQALHGAG